MAPDPNTGLTVKSLFLLLGVLSGAAPLAPAPALAQWRPGKPVEIVLPGAQGGSGDLAVRRIVDIINKHKLASLTITPVNKPGGSGADAFGYFLKADPDHTLLMANKVFYMAPLRRKELGVDVTTFTPVAAMGADMLALWVPSSLPGVASLPDFIKAVREKTARGGTWIMAGMGQDSEDHLLTNYLNANYKLAMKYEGFPSGSDPAKRLAAGAADSAVNTVLEQKALLAGAGSRPIVVFGKERSPRLPDTPTLRETGDNFSPELQRAISGPPDMSLEAQLFYASLFRNVFHTPEWRAYREENCLTGRFMSGPGLVEYWQDQVRMRKSMLAVIDVFMGFGAAGLERGAPGAGPR